MYVNHAAWKESIETCNLRVSGNVFIDGKCKRPSNSVGEWKRSHLALKTFEFCRQPGGDLFAICRQVVSGKQ